MVLIVRIQDRRGTGCRRVQLCFVGGDIPVVHEVIVYCHVGIPGAVGVIQELAELAAAVADIVNPAPAPGVIESQAATEEGDSSFGGELCHRACEGGDG